MYPRSYYSRKKYVVRIKGDKRYAVASFDRKSEAEALVKKLVAANIQFKYMV